MTGKYNPLAEFLTRMIDGYIETYLDTCKRIGRQTSLEDFKDLLNNKYMNGELSAKACETFAQRYRVLTNQS